MSPAQTRPDDRLSVLRTARDAAQRAAIEVARSAGAQLSVRPVYPGAPMTVRDVEPLAGMRASRQVELGARVAARDYIRRAREAGHGWHQIGHALELVPGAALDQQGMTVAEAAYSRAVRRPDTDTTPRYGRSFVWQCRSCEHAISKRGLCDGPADDEHGHADNCARLSATAAAWDAQWEAGQ
jgi:hypothetical protein